MGGAGTPVVGAFGTDASTSGVPPTDTPTNCVLGEDVPGEGVPSTDTLTNGVLDEDAPGTDTFTGGVLPTDTLSRGAVARDEDASEPCGSIAWAPAAPSAAHKPTNNTTAAVPASLNRTVGRAGCAITHEPWRG